MGRVDRNEGYDKGCEECRSLPDYVVVSKQETLTPLEPHADLPVCGLEV